MNKEDKAFIKAVPNFAFGIPAPVRKLKKNKRVSIPDGEIKVEELKRWISENIG